jgi:hypothetical protein
LQRKWPKVTVAMICLMVIWNLPIATLDGGAYPYGWLELLRSKMSGPSADGTACWSW